MPQIFENGGAPDFLGTSFTNGNAFLILFRDTLVSAGWSLVSEQLSGTDTIGDFVRLSATEAGASNVAYYEVAIADNTSNYIDGYELSFIAAQTSGYTTTSLALTIPYIGNGVESRAWITADEEAFCVTVRSYAGLGGAVFGGWLDRIEPITDAWGYVIGKPVSDPATSYYQIAKSFHNNTNWRRIAEDFANGTLSYNSDPYFPMQGVIDRYTKPMSKSGSFGINNEASGLDFMENLYNGNLDGTTGKAILGDFWVVEGFGSSNAYSLNGVFGHKLYFRGAVKFVYTGMASFLPYTQVVDDSGTRYISTGDFSWQGQQITA